MMPAWEIALRIIGTIIVPIAGTVLAYLLDSKVAGFARIPKIFRYIILGIIFGGLSICGYYLGANIPYVTTSGDTKYVVFGTTAFAPFISGLLFNWPVPLIAGVIGAIFRGLINAEDVISIAVVVAILFGVVFTIFLRKVVLRNEKPKWYHAAVGSIFVECINNIMIFVLSRGTIQESYQIVRYMDFVVILAEIVAAIIIFVLISVINRTIHEHSGRHLSVKIQRNAFILTAVALAGLAVGSYALMSNKSEQDAIADIDNTLIDVYWDANTRTKSDPDSHDLLFLNLADNRHIEATGFVIVIARAHIEIPDHLPPLVFDPGDVVSCQKDYDTKVINPVGTDQQKKFLGDGHDIEYFIEKYSATPEYIRDKWKIPTFTLRFTNAAEGSDITYLANIVPCYKKDGSSCHAVMCVISLDEVLLNAGVSSRIIVYAGAIIFVFLYILLYILIDRLVVDKIHKVNASLSRIMDGNVDEHIEIKDSIEFEELTTDINLTVGALKNYGEEINRRIEGDLELARNIQYNAIPLIFPYEHEYEIYATMYTAKEVGGDFYDYLKLKGNRVMILIADVSGKGIPASLYMMRAKTLIKSLAHSIDRPEDILEAANNELCEQNKSGLFVTAWLGILNTKTGVLNYANAGHCLPLVRHNEDWHYMVGNKNFVLGGFANLKFKPNQVKLAPSDMLLLYTDGVTEATSKMKELFGEDRLLKLVQSVGCTNPESLVDKISERVNDFQKGVDQFDDITMLSLRYFGSREASKNSNGEIALYAQLGNVPTAVNFIKYNLRHHHFRKVFRTSVALASNEILDNIVAHIDPKQQDNERIFKVKIKIDAKKVEIDFKDNGLPFNLTKTATGEATTPIDEKAIGLYIVKQNVDKITYKRTNSENVLTIVKKIIKTEG